MSAAGIVALGPAAAQQEPSEASAAGDMLLMVLTGVMWALSLAALAGVAWLMGRWMRRREALRRNPADDGARAGASAATSGGRRPGSRAARRSIRRGKRRQDNASDLDGWA